MPKSSETVLALAQKNALARQLDAALREAETLRNAGKIAEAGALCQRILKADPRHAGALHMLGMMALNTDSFDLAISSLQRALTEKPRSATILSDLGLALTAAGKPAEAISALRKAIDLRPGDAAIFLRLGDAQVDLDQPGDALKSYRKALALAPTDPLAAHMVAALSSDSAAPDTHYVTRLFDNYAPTFETHLTGALAYRTPQVLREAIAPLLPSPGPRSTLDLGCGTGLVANVFHDIVNAIDGIDIAPAMIEAARAKGLYRTLRAGDFQTLLPTDPDFAGPYDLVLAADVFVYVGALETTFATILPRLAPGGLFGFSTELHPGAGVAMRSSGRFAHAPDYIAGLAARHGMTLVSQTESTIRKERGRPIAGQVFVLRAPF